LSNRESHPIRNGVIASVVGGILLSLWPPFRDLLLNVTSWVWNGIKALALWLSSIQDVYGWILLLLIILSIPTISKIASLLSPNKEASTEDLYKSDNLFGAIWQWSYSNGSIHNLWSLCPECKSELVYSEFMPNPYDYTHDGLEPKTEFSCERCNSTKCTLKGDKEYATGTVEREIRRKIRNSEWKNQQNS